jgi:hypothetical protein
MKTIIFAIILSVFTVTLKADTDALYAEKSIELASILYGVLEIGEKSCKATGSKMPTSLSSWWSAVDTYSAGEIARDKKLKAAIAEINAKLDALKDTSTSENQLEYYNLNIASIDASIESIEGTGGRIPLRKALLVALESSLSSNASEYQKVFDAYKLLMETTIPKAIQTASDACERMKNGVKDPVKGCDEAKEKLPLLKSVELQNFGVLYSLYQVPSSELNNKLEYLEKKLKERLAAITKSDDQKYDWSTSIETGIASLESSRKTAGTKCPNVSPLKDYDRTVLDTIVKELNSKSNETLTATISSSTDTLLTAIGVDTSTSDLASTFNSAWGPVDLVIGQAEQRPVYFEFTKTKITELLVLDEELLQTLKTNREKYATLIDEVKKTLTTNSVTNTSTATSSVNANSTYKIISTNTALSSAIKSSSKETSSTASSVGTTLGLNVSSSNSTSTSSSSSTSTSTTSTKSSGTTSNTLSSTSVKGNTISSLSAIAKSKSNSTVVSSNKTSAISINPLTNSKNVNNNTTSLNQVSQNKIFSNAISSKLNKIVSQLQTETVKKDSILENSNIQNANLNQVSLSSITLKKASSSYLSSKITSADIEDASVLKNAIDNSKKRNQSEFIPNESDSLFEVVTKAYIRNYDKISTLNP